jgi:hypothetical protein
LEGSDLSLQLLYGFLRGLLELKQFVLQVFEGGRLSGGQRNTEKAY